MEYIPITHNMSPLQKEAIEINNKEYYEWEKTLDYKYFYDDLSNEKLQFKVYSENYDLNLRELKKICGENSSLISREKNNQYFRDRVKTDVLFRMRVNMRGRLSICFKTKGYKRLETTIKLIGCDFNEALNYIESNFKDKMTWDNYGEWEIDHKIPLCIANNKDELIKLCHYTNLQPLWKSENRKKI